MRSESLSPNPIAVFLLELAERRATGTLELEGRRIAISDGDVIGVWPNAQDESIGEFLAKSGRIPAQKLRQTIVDAEHAGLSLETYLVQQRVVTEHELTSARRALWLDRVVRALRESSALASPQRPDFDQATPEGNPAHAVRTVNLTLDALARCAAELDASDVGRRLNDRLLWNESALSEPAQRWAAFGRLPDRPAVSTILARNPAAAPHIAALVRAGLARLNSPGEATSPRKREITLPPPPPRLAPIEARVTPPMDAVDSVPPAAPRPPKMRLDPGADIGPVPIITRVSLRTFAAATSEAIDPLKAIEENIATLEANQAPASERADAYCQLAETYLSRLGSVEDAARAYREAAAAFPSHIPALEHAARLCNTLGQTELALAYANAIVFAAHNGSERAQALRLAAALGRPTGQADAVLEALCEAAAEDETDPEPHEIVARSLAERGNVEGAIAHGRLAASVWMAEQPDRARSLIAWVDELGPADPSRSREHAAALVATNHPEAAVAILAAAARAISDADDKRGLMLEAAQQAESVGRPDLAAELLTEAYDAEPHVDIFYEPLLADLASASMQAERAVIASELAAFTEGEASADWLVLAGESLLQLNRGSLGAVHLFARANQVAPLHGRALDALREHASTGRERDLLTDALERSARASEDADATLAAALWRELSSMAEDQLGAVRRALWAMEQVSRLLPRDSGAGEAVTRLAEKARIQDGLVAAAEREVESANTEQRPKALRGLIAMLRDLPESRDQLTRLHEEYLAEQPDDETHAGQYEWLLAVRCEWTTLAAWLRSRQERVASPHDRARLLDRLMLACTEQNDDRGTAETALALLSVSPEHSEAIARLNRAAIRLNDATLRREALTRGAQVANTPRLRGRSLSLLAGLLERTGELDAAVAAADQALLADQSAADAALLLLRHAYRLPTERAAAALELSRTALGDSQPLLSTLARAATAAGDLPAQQRALDAWHRLSPLDPDANLSRLAARMKGDNPQAVRQAAEGCLALDVVGPSTATALRGAIARLAGLGAVDQAAGLAERAVSVLGVRDANLLDQSLSLARRSGQRDLLTAALEHRLVTLEGPARTEALREIAEHHRSGGDVVAEAHALVRMLPAMPVDSETLDRLATLYAEQGDGERLLAALSLAARGVSDPVERRKRLLDMAAAAGQVLGDQPRALGYVREVICDLADDRDSLLHALGALFSISTDDRSALRDALILAKETDPRLGGTICEWVAKTAEDGLRDPALALRLATEGLEAFPNQPGLLLIVERLALSLGDVDLAMGTYDKLGAAAMGHHGRRALHYRAGRWLERAGNPQRALEKYVDAFDMAPGAGVAFRAIERVARSTGQLTPLVHVYETLAGAMHQPTIQAELLQQAAALCLDGANDQPRAFHLLLRAWQVTGESELQTQLTDVATARYEHNAEQGRELFAHFVDALLDRAEKTWDASAKVDILLDVARIEGTFLSQTDASAQALAAATQAAAGEDLNPETLARLRAATGQQEPEPEPEALADAEQQTDTAALPAVHEEQVIVPEPAEAIRAAPLEPTVAANPPPQGDPVVEAAAETVVAEDLTPEPAALTSETRAEEGTTSTRYSSRPFFPTDLDPVEMAPESTTLPYDTVLPTLEEEHAPTLASETKRQTGSYERPDIDAPRPSLPVAAPLPPRRGGTLPQTPRAELVPPAEKASTLDATAPHREPREVATREEQLRTAIANGDVGACEELSDLLATTPDGLTEAHAVLRTLVNRQPWRTSALRKLLSLASRVSATAEERTVSELLSVFDTSISAVACPPFGTDQWHAEDIENAIRDVTDSKATRILTITWEAARAMPRYRKHLSMFDVAERDRVTPGVAHPVADAMVWSASTLRMESTALYLRRDEEPRVFVAATNPPCLIATTGATRLGSTLLFQLGSALVRARPEHALLSTLPADDGRTLVQAINAAFGPAGGEPVSRGAAHLASELWHTMPMRSQREVRDLLASDTDRLDYDALGERASQLSARAGLMVAGSPRHAIFALTATDPVCRLYDMTTEQGFIAAAQASPALQAVIRFALSDAYLMARIQL